MKKLIYGFVLSVLINITLVSLTTIAYRGDEYLFVTHSVVIIGGTILGSRIAEKFL